MVGNNDEYDDDNVVTLIEITPLEPAFRDYFHLASSLNIKLFSSQEYSFI